MSKNKTSEGSGLAGTLLIVFLVLKLTGVVSWSWWWVLSPLWISLALTILVFIVIGVIILIESKS